MEFAILASMRIVGKKHSGLNAAPLTPQEAWQRGRALDALLPNPAPALRGVFRLTHAQRNAQDDERMLALARRLNAAQVEHGPP
ncbi:MAG: hypothetical protein WCJ76_04890 [Comamonadaceae bacterium]